MLRPIIPLACLVGLATALPAQEKPTLEQQHAVAGTWKLDQARSDTVSTGALRGLRTNAGLLGRAAGGNNGSDGAAAGGGRRRGGGGGGSTGGTGGGGGASPPLTAADSAAIRAAGDRAAQAVADPHMALVQSDINPGAGLVIAVNDSAVSIANARGEQSSFRTDARRRQVAQMDGSIVETQAEWKDGALTIERGVAGTAMLKREFKPAKDGNTLEVKETVDAGGGKVQKKLTFTRQ